MQEKRSRQFVYPIRDTKHATESGDVIWTVATASFGFALVQLDVTIVNVALPAIARSLNASVAQLQWVVDAYTLSFAALLLSGGETASVIAGLHLSAGISALLLVTAAMLAFLGLSPVRPLAAWGEQRNDSTKAPQLAGARRAAYRGRIPEDRTTEMDDHQ